MHWIFTNEGIRMQSKSRGVISANVGMIFKSEKDVMMTKQIKKIISMWEEKGGLTEASKIGTPLTGHIKERPAK